jgi:DNA polymerase-3 subunit alpha
MYGELYDQHRAQVVEDAVLVLEVKVRDIRRGDGEGESIRRISVEKVYDVTAARNRFARGLRLHCNGQLSGTPAQQNVRRLQALLSPWRNGPCPVQVVVDNGRATAPVTLGEAWNVNLDEALVAGLAEWLQPDCVEIVY